MPRGKKLNDNEKSRIDAFKEIGLSNLEISRRINRSEHVVRSYIKLGKDYGKPIPKKGNTKISNRQKNRIRAEAAQNKLNAAEIVKKLDLPIKQRRVQQILHCTPNLKYKKMNKKPLLKSHHKKNRKLFARRHMSWDSEWKTVFFSDEKKFNLDGPDGCSCYWHDLSKKTPIRFSRNFQGGSVMVWGGFSALGKAPLAFISTKMNSNDYTSMLDVTLIPYLEEVMSEKEFLFQQDNAAIHVSRFSKGWFEEINIPFLEWPACSPDFNTIENLWGYMAQKLYHAGKQYKTVQELKSCIDKCWEDIPMNLISKLVESMPSRIFSAIEKSGGHTSY